MRLLIYYTIFVVVCWIGFFLDVTPGEGEYEQANHSYWAEGFLLLTIVDAIGWIISLWNWALH
jgi:hypothetical protein